MTHHDHDHAHDLGFAHDLPVMLGRRRLLALMGGVGLMSLTGGAAAALECVALPWETAGPYPADGSNVKDGQVVNALTEQGVIRQDLRTSFGTLTPVADGLQLDLELTLVNADGCTPLEGHAIYLWHCDTVGKYSLYDLTDANYLRGVGVADAEGKVRFTTIVPGCYDGRWPHMHFEAFESVEAAVSGEASLLTAQIALPEAESAAVYAADARYSNGTQNLERITIATDNVFSDNSEEQIAQQTLALTGDPATGYVGTVTIAVDLTAERSAGGMMAPPDGMGAGGPPSGEPPAQPPQT
jgi:protocatechuate 3,4-dioxygenase beta subunit